MSRIHSLKRSYYLSIPTRLGLMLVLLAAVMVWVFVLVVHADGPIVTKTVDDDTPTPGQLVTYTIVISNSDGYNYTDALISDTLPISLTFAGPVTIYPPQPGATLAQDAGDLPTLASGLTVTAGEQVTLTFPVTVNTGLFAGTVITNTAAVTCTEVVTPATSQVGLTVSPIRVTAVYPSFDSTNIQAFNLVGQAALSGTRLQLTPSHEWRFGTAWWKDKVSLEDSRSFSAYFTFEISNSGAGGADGIVFVIQTQSSDAGSSGVGIGYEGINNSVGIEFDTWHNGGDPVYDPNGNHIGVDINGSVHSLQTADVTSIGTLDAGGVYSAWVDYDGPSNLLEVRLGTGPGRRPQRSAARLISNRTLGQTSTWVLHQPPAGPGLDTRSVPSTLTTTISLAASRPIPRATNRPRPRWTSPHRQPLSCPMASRRALSQPP